MAVFSDLELERIMNEAGISEEDLEKVEDIEFDYE